MKKDLQEVDVVNWAKRKGIAGVGAAMQAQDEYRDVMYAKLELDKMRRSFERAASSGMIGDQPSTDNIEQLIGTLTPQDLQKLKTAVEQRIRVLAGIQSEMS